MTSATRGASPPTRPAVMLAARSLAEAELSLAGGGGSGGGSGKVSMQDVRFTTRM